MLHLTLRRVQIIAHTPADHEIDWTEQIAQNRSNRALSAEEQLPYVCRAHPQTRFSCSQCTHMETLASLKASKEMTGAIPVFNWRRTECVVPIIGKQVLVRERVVVHHIKQPAQSAQPACGEEDTAGSAFRPAATQP